MRQYKRHRTVGELLKMCKEQKVYIDTRHWDRGGDTICIGAPADDPKHAWVIYNTFNGVFFGRTQRDPVGHHPVCSGDSFIQGSLDFTSDSKLDHLPWFQKLLDFFYTNDPGPQRAAKTVDYVLGGTRLLELD